MPKYGKRPIQIEAKPLTEWLERHGANFSVDLTTRTVEVEPLDGLLREEVC